MWNRPETKWSNYEHAEKKINTFWKAKLTFVKKNGEELWLGVKGQSNLEIAGFLRNLFK